MATYETDLTLITDCYTGTVTVVEMGAPYALGNLGAIDAENFIEGAGCITQETKNAVDLGASVAFDNLSAITMAADDVVFMWGFFAVGADLYTYATSGHVMIIGSTLTAYDAFAISGSDRTPNPRGGWYNFAVDPTQPPTTAYGGGSTAHRYFGTGVSMIAKIAKGNPHAIDAIRYGRGEIYCTGADCTFIGMAAENDDNITNQNKWGLFQDVGGSYLWKGLMSIGQTATSASFSQTGATIAIDDMYHVYSHFNKIEFHNTSTYVNWDRVTFNSLSTVSPGHLEVVDDCSVNFLSCTFNAMGWFKFQSKTRVTGTNFIGCASINQGSSVWEESLVADASGGVSIYVNNMDLINNCNFESNGSNHAMYLGPDSSGQTYSIVGHSYTDYAVVDGDTGNEVIYNNSGGEVIINYSGGDQPTIKNGTDYGDSSTAAVSSVTLSLTVKDSAGDPILGALTFIDDPALTAPFIMNTSTNSSGIASVGWGGGPVSDAVWRVRLYGYKPFVGISDIPAENKDIPVTLIIDPQQT